VAAATAAPVTAPTFVAPSTEPASSAPVRVAEYVAPSSSTASSSTASSSNASSSSAPAAPAPAAAVPLVPSQAATAPPQAPQKFRANPLAIPYSPSEAGPSGSNYMPNDVVMVMSGSSRVFDFPHRIRRISLADTEVADIQVVNPYQINLIGHKEGFTTLAIWDTQGHYEERQVRVDPFGRQQVMLNVIVAELNRGRIEQDGLNWSAAFTRANISLFNNLGGGPATPASASTNFTSSGKLGSTTGPYMPLGGQLLPPMLSNNLTYGISAGSANFLQQTFFEYLEAHNLGKVLSEPRLLANSGEKAEFLDGGEIPIVITQALNSTIVFKQFGTSVIFVPTVVGKDEIELSVKPEVSQPDFGQGVNLFGFTVPAFVTRRAQTVVRLRNNQTLIIAGLILRTPTSSVNKVPYLGDLPWIGNAFKNTSYNNSESDLMMSVTPQIVQPLPNYAQVAEPSSAPAMSADDIRTERLAQPDVSRPRF
jgi:Flp pilus assembly secretin CpaC